MFSGSLLSLMVHSLPPEAMIAFPRGDKPPFTVPTSRRLAERLEQARINWTGEWPKLPVVGRVDPELVGRAKSMTKHEISSDPEFVWGRIPLDDLIKHYLATSEDLPDKEYMDLGTPVWAASTTTGSTSKITNLLAQTASPTAATVGAALVDLGKTPAAGMTNVPQDFGGKLRHVTYPSGTSIDLSTHAEEVLEVLLDRLSAKKMLTTATVSMALINNPTPDQIRLSKNCFDQHCAPEMLDAVQAINKLLDGDKLSDGTLMPAVVNMSVGTHVGPHNGYPHRHCRRPYPRRHPARLAWQCGGSSNGGSSYLMAHSSHRPHRCRPRRASAWPSFGARPWPATPLPNPTTGNRPCEAHTPLSQRRNTP
jgi:hypothetical protein